MRDFNTRIQVRGHEKIQDRARPCVSAWVTTVTGPVARAVFDAVIWKSERTRTIREGPAAYVIDLLRRDERLRMEGGKERRVTSWHSVLTQDEIRRYNAEQDSDELVALDKLIDFAGARESLDEVIAAATGQIDEVA